MLDGTLPCYVEYLRFIYNIKIKELDDIDINKRNIKDDYKNLMTCLEIIKNEKERSNI
tara:strand:- start:751 stop:924 length:174 start_codon:yes stop_codon:yes gene_type:complete